MKAEDVHLPTPTTATEMAETRQWLADQMIESGQLKEKDKAEFIAVFNEMNKDKLPVTSDSVLGSLENYQQTPEYQKKMATWGKRLEAIGL